MTNNERLIGALPVQHSHSQQVYLVSPVHVNRTRIQSTGGLAALPMKCGSTMQANDEIWKE